MAKKSSVSPTTANFVLSNKTMKFSPYNPIEGGITTGTVQPYNPKSLWFNNEQQKICMAPFNYPITYYSFE